MIWKFFEESTMIYTGSDGDPKKKLIWDLKEVGMAGEGKVNDLVWIVKTHFPAAAGKHHFWANKVILIVWNPIDTLVSLFHFESTGTHNMSVCEADWERHSTDWDFFLKRKLELWVKYHEFWISGRHNVPLYIVKYEDLKANPISEMRKIYSYLLKINESKIEGTLLELLIKKSLGKKDLP